MRKRFSPSREKEDPHEKLKSKHLKTLIEQAPQLLVGVTTLHVQMLQPHSGMERTGQEGRGLSWAPDHSGAGTVRLTRGMVTATSTLISGLMQVPSK